MVGWPAYVPQTEAEQSELAEYYEKWGRRGLDGLACHELDYAERAGWSRKSLALSCSPRRVPPR